jgi:hypothetical protein
MRHLTRDSSLKDTSEPSMPLIHGSCAANSVASCSTARQLLTNINVLERNQRPCVLSHFSSAVSASNATPLRGRSNCTPRRRTGVCGSPVPTVLSVFPTGRPWTDIFAMCTRWSSVGLSVPLVAKLLRYSDRGGMTYTQCA